MRAEPEAEMSTHLLRICCPSCQRMLKAGPQHLNKRVVCNHCRSPFVARPEVPEAVVPPPRFAINPEAAVVSSTAVASGCVGTGQATETGPVSRIEASL